MKVTMTPARLSVTSGLANLVLVPFGAMPMCHGAGGLAAHYRFGARSGAAPLALGAVLVALALLPGGLAMAALTAIPVAALGALLLFAAGELAITKRLFDCKPSCWPVIAIAAGATVLLDPFWGLLAGTVGGLGQDLLSGGIVGISGLAKTPVGLLSGVIGTQLVLVRPSGRALVVAAATAVHRLLMMGVIALVEQHWSGTTWGAMLTEIALNTAAGYIVFQIVGALPGVMERQRLSRRASFGRRQW